MLLSGRPFYELWTDGSCDNAGKPPVGFLIGGGIVLQRVSMGIPHSVLLEAIGISDGTSNIAEWATMLHGLTTVREALRTIGDAGALIHVYSDSQLVVKSLNKDWMVKDETLYTIAFNCFQAINSIEGEGHTIDISWIPREKNQLADDLSKIGRLTSGGRPFSKVYKNRDEVAAALNEIQRQHR